MEPKKTQHFCYPLVYQQFVCTLLISVSTLFLLAFYCNKTAILRSRTLCQKLPSLVPAWSSISGQLRALIN